MDPLILHDFHQDAGARFSALNGEEIVSDYGDISGEHAALAKNAAVLDLSFRSRLCVIGTERTRFLHGQLTNHIKALRPGQGCYSALTTAKGKLQSDLNVYCLPEELLLDFEPGLTTSIQERLEKFVVADDVQIVNVQSLYGLLSVQGPKSGEVVTALGWFGALPAAKFSVEKTERPDMGEVYVMNNPRLGTAGFDIFVPTAQMVDAARNTLSAVRQSSGRLCGWAAFEIARIEAGLPRYGADMDETNFPQECGIDERAVNYNKGCYIGQEVLNRIHTMGHVNRRICRLEFARELNNLPVKGDELFFAGKEVGYVTSATRSMERAGNIGLGYVRHEVSTPGTALVLKTAEGESAARIMELHS